MNNQFNNTRKIKKICVFTGSSSGIRPEYNEGAILLGKEMVKREIGLVYGGADIGLMGTIANTVLHEGGHVIGVMPQALVDMEVAHSNLSEIHIVSNMHKRKALMSDLSDGFIALPGGLGTLEELFEVLTWAQLGFHDKSCSVLDICGYYQELLAFLNKGVIEGFIKEDHKSMLIVESNPSVLLDQIENYKAPSISKLPKNL